MADQAKNVSIQPEIDDIGNLNINAQPGNIQPLPANSGASSAEGASSIPPPRDYNMTHEERGVALIIDNKTFDARAGWKARAGTDVDFEKMYELLHTLGINEIIGRRDRTKHQMIDDLKQVAAMDFTNKDCFVCVILSYGGEGYVYGTGGKVTVPVVKDEKIELEKIMEPFKRTKGLAGKPKLFFIQACSPENAETHDGRRQSYVPPEEFFQRIPLEADRLCVVSCIQGSLGWSSGEQGSKSSCWFVEELTKAINKNWETKDLLTIMTRMNKALAKKFDDENAKRGSEIPKKLPYVTSSLTKDLFFKLND